MDKKQDEAIVSVAMPATLAARVAELAEAEMISRSAFIRRTLNSAVKNSQPVTA
jgi:metal-responsive CopG/Arc/MetJ family transcriptional regulator